MNLTSIHGARLEDPHSSVMLTNKQVITTERISSLPLASNHDHSSSKASYCNLLYAYSRREMASINSQHGTLSFHEYEGGQGLFYVLTLSDDCLKLSFCKTTYET
ncbi:hypothetical protein C0J52_17249 [Blattella germanica]|nr:hypothetical protein C0J52_17249 [Blattella germanica]